MRIFERTIALCRETGSTVEAAHSVRLAADNPSPKKRMNKFIALFAVAIVLTGCAAGPDKAALQTRKEALTTISKVEIFYNDKDELVVMDGGGSTMAGMAGIFGPVGMLVALGADATSKLTLAERAEARSKEFTALVGKSETAQTLNRQFAEELASRMRAGGKEVKVTPVQRIKGDLASANMPNASFTAGYAPLVLRITSGYGAKDALSRYKPIIVIEQTLKRDGQEKALYRNTFTSPADEPTYMAYSSLLERNKEAHDGLRRAMVNAADAVYQSMFVIAQ